MNVLIRQYLNRRIAKIARSASRGKERRLMAEQEDAAQAMLIDKAPNQLKLPFALWNRETVHLAIKKKFGVVLPMRTITDYLKRWGFTPQKQVKRAYEQDFKKVQAWLGDEYPSIAARAKEEKAEIHWGDETGIQNTAYNAKGFAPTGEPPVIRLNAKRCRVIVISSITNTGKVRFMLYRETMTSALLIKFMSRLIRNVSQKVFLILDNLRIHHNRSLRPGWRNTRSRSRSSSFLPTVLNINPDEYLNGDLKKLHALRSSIKNGKGPEQEDAVFHENASTTTE